MKEFVRLRAKIYSYLKRQQWLIKKKQKAQKCVSYKKQNLNFKIIKNCLEAAQIERKINYLRKKKIDVDSLKEDQKGFVKNNKLIY